MHFELVFAFMLAIASAVALIARRVRMPFTAALVLAGLGLGLAAPFEAPHLTKDLLYAVFLPGLLFEAAYHLPFDKFWKNKLAITSLAIPGLIAAVALTAAILTPAVAAFHLEADFLFVHALVFSALIAATDPIAVVALFKSMGAPKRLLVLIEGESLINDGAAVVVFLLVLELAQGQAFSAAHAFGEFALVAGMGLGVGLLCGFGVSLLTRRIDDPLIEITLTTIAAYGSFAVAEHFHFSGVIATVVAAIVCGNYGARTGMSATTRIAVESFWEYVAFAFNSFVFLLIGLEVKLDDMLASWQPILVAYAAVLAARAVVVYGATLLLRRTREQIPWKWAAVLTWGGLRGALSMVLVLGLVADFPHRTYLVTITFGVVVLSILVQGLTMAPLMRLLGVVKHRERSQAYDQHNARLQAANAALREIATLDNDRRAPKQLLEVLREQYTQRIADTEEAIRALRLERETLHAEEEHQLARHLIMVEKAAVQDASRDGFVEADAAAALVQEIDGRLFALENGRSNAPRADVDN